MSVQENEITKNKPAKQFLKPAEIAAMLGVSVETVHNYRKDGLFLKSEYITVERGERSRYLFYATAVETFAARLSGQFPAKLVAEEKKRPYYKRVTKGTRK